MAGISNIAFRRIAKRFGAGLVCNEMVSDKALYYDSLKTKQMCAIDEMNILYLSSCLVMTLIRLCMQLNIWIRKQIVTLLTLIWVSRKQGYQSTGRKLFNEGY